MALEVLEVGNLKFLCLKNGVNSQNSHQRIGKWWQSIGIGDFPQHFQTRIPMFLLILLFPRGWQFAQHPDAERGSGWSTGQGHENWFSHGKCIETWEVLGSSWGADFFVGWCVSIVKYCESGSCRPRARDGFWPLCAKDPVVQLIDWVYFRVYRMIKGWFFCLLVLVFNHVNGKLGDQIHPDDTRG